MTLIICSHYVALTAYNNASKFQYYKTTCSTVMAHFVSELCNFDHCYNCHVEAVHQI